MKYIPLITINVEHAFYADKKSPDFQILPDRECRSLLQKHRMLWREGLSSWQVVTPLSEWNEPLLPLTAGTILRFFLKLTNPKVLQFTHFPADLALNEVLQGHAFLRYQNLDGAALSANLFHYYQEQTFVVSHPASGESFFLESPPIPGLSELDFTINGLAVSHPENYREAEKKLTISTINEEAGTVFSISYRAIPTWARGVFGVIDLEIQDPAEVGKIYQIALEPRTAKWKYYVVSDKSEDHLSVKDSEEGAGRIVFHRETISQDDPVANWLQKKFPEAPTVALYQSGAGIAYEEQRSKNIRLVDVMQHDQVLVDHLPVPSRENPEVQIVNYFS